jgi:hypothetical protein
MDDLEMLVNAAHDLYEEISIFEAMDASDRQTAIDNIIEYYGPQDMGKIEKYLTIIDKIKAWEENGPEM